MNAAIELLRKTCIVANSHNLSWAKLSARIPSRSLKNTLVPAVFLPGTRFRFIWDVVSTLGIVYFALSVLYQIAFSPVDERTSKVFGFELLFDMFLTVDFRFAFDTICLCRKWCKAPEQG